MLIKIKSKQATQKMAKLRETTFPALCEAINKLFGESQAPYCIYYREKEGDFILVEDNDDLELCLEEAKETNTKPKFYLFEPGTEPSETRDNISTTLVELEKDKNDEENKKNIVTKTEFFPCILGELEPQEQISETDKNQNVENENIEILDQKKIESKLESRAFNEAHIGIKCQKCNIEPIVGGRFIIINKGKETLKMNFCRKCADTFSDETVMVKMASPVPPPQLNNEDLPEKNQDNVNNNPQN